MILIVFAKLQTRHLLTVDWSIPYPSLQYMSLGSLSHDEPIGSRLIVRIHVLEDILTLKAVLLTFRSQANYMENMLLPNVIR